MKCYNFASMPTIEPNELSERELEILKLLATGVSNKEIAHKLFISSNTVKVHLRNIFTKIGSASRTEAAMYAVRIGLIETAAPQPLSSEEVILPSASVETNSAQTIQPQTSLARIAGFFRPTFRTIALLTAVLLIIIIFAIVLRRDRNAVPGVRISPTYTPRVQWFELAGLPTPRRGLAVASYENEIYAIGGESAEGVTNIVEKYNPQTNSWSTLPPKPTPVSEINAAVIGGLIYVPGGTMLNGEPTDATEVFDPASDRWYKGVSLPAPLSAYAMAVYEGKLYLFGGWDGAGVVNNAYVFDPNENKWSAVPSMPSARSKAGAAVVGSRIYIIGGWDGKQASTANEIFQPDITGNSSQWVKGLSLPSGRFAEGVASIADIIFVIGGTSSADELTVIALSPEDTMWGFLDAPIQKGWSSLGAVTAGTRLYVLGGVSNEKLTSQMWSYQAIFTITLPIIH